MTGNDNNSNDKSPVPIGSGRKFNASEVSEYIDAMHGECMADPAGRIQASNQWIDDRHMDRFHDALIGAHSRSETFKSLARPLITGGVRDE